MSSKRAQRVHSQEQLFREQLPVAQPCWVMRSQWINGAALQISSA